MKKIVLSIIALCMGMCAMAQTKFYVYNTDGIMVEYTIEDVDSISFVGSDVATTTEPLPGVFTVAEGKTVKFAPGNLQYKKSTKKWSFAANQYDMIGTYVADKIDLFEWSTNNETAKWGVSSTCDGDYSGGFVDWGLKIGDGNTWRTLTLEEWIYLFESRADAVDKYGIAYINLDARTSVLGLIILPDSWTAPAGISFAGGLPSEEVIDNEDYQNFTLAQWQLMEQAGAVLLRARGDGCGDWYGSYWTATPCSSDRAYRLFFPQQFGYKYVSYGYNSSGSPYATGRCGSSSVRLVQDVK